MANMRAKDKGQLHAWVPDVVYKEVVRLAKATGRPRSAVIEEMIVEGMRKHGIKIPEVKK